MRIGKVYRLLCSFILTTSVFAWAGAETVDKSLPFAEYSVRPDPRDCVGFPQCGGYFLYEIDGTAPAAEPDLCTADFPLAGYVVRCMLLTEDGSLQEFYPSCDVPTVGTILPDLDYKGYKMLVVPVQQ